MTYPSGLSGLKFGITVDSVGNIWLINQVFDSPKIDTDLALFDNQVPFAGNKASSFHRKTLTMLNLRPCQQSP